MSNLKPFDLEAAMRGEPVVTKNGEEVKIAGYKSDAVSMYSVLAWVKKERGWVGECYTIDGRTITSDGELFMNTKNQE